MIWTGTPCYVHAHGSCLLPMNIHGFRLARSYYTAWWKTSNSWNRGVLNWHKGVWRLREERGGREQCEDKKYGRTRFLHEPTNPMIHQSNPTPFFPLHGVLPHGDTPNNLVLVAKPFGELTDMGPTVPPS